MEILVKLNSIDLVRAFLETQTFLLTDQVLIQFAQMISHFGFERLKKDLVAFKRPTVQKLTKYCHMIEVIYNQFF